MPSLAAAFVKLRSFATTRNEQVVEVRFRHGALASKPRFMLLVDRCKRIAPTNPDDQRLLLLPS